MKKSEKMATVYENLFEKKNENRVRPELNRADVENKVFSKLAFIKFRLNLSQIRTKKKSV